MKFEALKVGMKLRSIQSGSNDPEIECVKKGDETVTLKRLKEPQRGSEFLMNKVSLENSFWVEAN